MLETTPTVAQRHPVGSGATTREALLEAAAARLQAVGWASFSFRDLAEQVGIRAPSIHYHFPTKSDLGVALVMWMRERRATCEHELIAAYPNPRDRLLALGDMIAERTCSTGKGKSCPIYALQAEFAILPEPMQQAVVGWIDDCLSGMTRWLEDGRSSGMFVFSGDAYQQALVVWSVLQQGTQLHRTHPHTDYVALVRQLVSTISS